MELELEEIKLYENFDDLADDVLTLAKEILPDKLIYINHLSDSRQVTLKVSDDRPDIALEEWSETKLDEALCDTVDYKNNRPLVYEDVTKEASLDYLRASFLEANINAYLGVPIKFQNGERFGTLCSVDDTPTHFDEKTVRLMKKIARMFSFYLELERLAFRDSLSGLYNRQFLYKYFANFPHEEGILCLFDLDGFKEVNDRHGHDRGDAVLIEMAEKLNRFTEPHEKAFAARLGGDEFVLHIPASLDNKTIDRLIHAMLKDLGSWNTDLQDTPLSSSIGVARYDAKKGRTLNRLLKDADSALYKAKKRGKNTYYLLDSE
ncbi:MAG: diguanylate cyclase domain-containing protein [Bacillota bacterium]